jgi:hypothetical protein
VAIKRLHGQTFDTVLAGALGLLFVAEIFGESGFDGHRPQALAVAVGFTAAPASAVAIRSSR